MKQGFKIKDWPQMERPRERLIENGPEALSNAELIAIILGTGNSRRNVVDLAKLMLKKYNLKKLSQASLNQIKEFRGVGNSKASQMVACFEIGKRLSTYKEQEKICISCAEDVARMLIPELRFAQKEHFIGLYLDSRNCLVKKDVISIGGLNASIVHPRELFKSAIRESANSVIIVHNHPSGNPKPSKDDIVITKKIVNAGRIIGIPVIDHIIIGDKNYVSVCEEKLMRF